jgi:hypothetical protein
LEDVVARFADDDSLPSYVFPSSLSIEQRQFAKTAVRRYANVRCESYGFGAERKLHLFKKREVFNIVGDASMPECVRMRVKNTFIDAWLDDGEAKCSCSPVIRSLPADLRSLVGSTASVASEIQEAIDAASTGKPHQSCKKHPLSIQVADEFSTAVGCVCRTPSSCNSPKQVQELGRSAGINVAAPPPTSPNNVVMLLEGTEVETDGLTQQPAFNGLTGTVQSWDSAMRRYDVLLDTPSGLRRVKLKRSNLKPRLPPPPLTAANASTTVFLESCIPCTDEADLYCAVESLASAYVASQNPDPHDSTERLPWHLCELSLSPVGWHGTDKVEDGPRQLPMAIWDELGVMSNSLHTLEDQSPCSPAMGNSGWLQFQPCAWQYHAPGGEDWLVPNKAENRC